MKRSAAKLIFIPAPVISHMAPMVEMAKLLTTRYQPISVTILILNFHIDTGVNTYTQSLLSNPNTPQLAFIQVPQTDPSTYTSSSPNTIFQSFVESHKGHVRDIVAGFSQSESTRIAGFVVDMFCVAMIDLANELKVPTFVFSPSNAAYLGLAFYLQILNDELEKDVTDLKDSDAELNVPSFVNSVPANVLPSIYFDKGGADFFLSLTRRFRECKGIIVNTFMELESYAIKSFDRDRRIPTVYPVGPLINFARDGHNSDEAAVIIRWLDDQPPSSVVFLCFGNRGSFPKDQVMEIAIALENSGHRFLWSLRPPAMNNEVKLSPNYTNLEEVLPRGFMERTSGKGKVIGWAPQAVVLSNRAVGGFVTHCGWNSLLESVWFGAPVATWPLYAEQQVNAFEMAIELHMAVDIKMDYRNDDIWNSHSEVIIRAEEIESKIKELMIEENIRKKVSEMKEKSRVTMLENGSSYTSLAHLVEEIIYGELGVS